MKKALLLGAALLLISSIAYAQLPPLGYLGLYADTEEPFGGTGDCEFVGVTAGARDTWCISVVGAQFYMWVWALPGEHGMKCAEFAIQYDDDLLPLEACLNPANSVAQGTLAAGLSICFTDCNYDWQWIAVQPIYSLTPSPRVIQIVEHPDTYPAPIYQFANCLENYPKEPCILYTNLYVNGTCGEIATEESNWGAIKGLFK
jgi:hypothetical protein